MFTLASLAVLLLAMFGFAAADAACSPQLSSIPGDGTMQTDPSLCLANSDEGTYTFGMWYTSNQDPYFYIMDSSCKILGAYDVPYDCQAPFSIQENFLKYTIVIDSRWIRAGAMQSDYGFEFRYANGEYRIGANQCTCGAANPIILPNPHGRHRPGYGAQSQQSATGCKCAFPVNGEP